MHPSEQPSSPLDDTFLLGRVAARDQEAFAELFRRHAPLVLGFLTRMAGSRSVAEEILQEVFLQAWRQADRFRPALATPRGWLLMLARSRALDLLRGEEARRRREQAVGSDPAPADEPLGTRRLEAVEDGRRLRSALDALPAEQRSAIEMAFFEGLNQRQIADRQSAPLGTVKSRVLLGMRKLRETLAASGAP